MSRFLVNQSQQHSEMEHHQQNLFQNPLNIQNGSHNEELVSRQQLDQQPRPSELTKPKGHHHHHKKNTHYDPLKIPCDWNLAAKHALARRVSKENDEISNPTYCTCCGYQIEREELPYDCEPVELKFLGSGFPLFYNFIKFCIFILFQFWLLKGMFCLATDLMGNYCNEPTTAESTSHKHLGNKNHHPAGAATGVESSSEDDNLTCGGSLWHFISLANIYDRPDLRRLQTNLSLLVVFINMITLVFFRKVQRSIDIEIDESQLTPSDYTICVKNIPQTNQDIKALLQNIFSHYAVPGKELEVTKIVLVYDIEEIIELEEEMKEVIKEKQKLLQENKMDFQDYQVKQIDEKIEKLEHKIHKIEHDLPKDNTKFAGIAFISFMTEEMKEQVLAHNNHSYWERVRAYHNEGRKHDPQPEELIVEGNKLYCEQAPEPNDVDWEFVHTTTRQKIKARVGAWSISIAFMLGCFFLIWFLTELADQMNDKVEEQEAQGIKDAATQTVATIMSQSISWTIIFFNKFVIGKVYHLIVDLEKISNKTKFNISFALKQSAALFINTALISLVIDFFITGNIIGKGGFIFNETNVFLLNAFVPPIVWFIDPWSMQFDFRRQKELKNPKSCVLTQQQANELMEMPDYSSAKRYGDIIKTMWFTFFYGDIIPVGIIFSILGLNLYYFIDKFNVLRRRTIKESLSKDLSIEMIELLELIILFTGIGNLIVSSVLFGEINWQDLVIIIISIIYGFLPMEEISQMLFPMKQKSETVPYTDAEEDFDTDYDRENPVTKKEALMEMNQKNR